MIMMKYLPAWAHLRKQNRQGLCAIAFGRLLQRMLIIQPIVAKQAAYNGTLPGYKAGQEYCTTLGWKAPRSLVPNNPITYWKTELGLT